jgi:uncharacterized protein (DUF58 family)
MHLLPTLRAMHLTRGALACLVLGVLLTSPDLTLMGGAILLGVFTSRAVSHVSLARARASGFEMLWRVDTKNISSTRLEEFELWAELQNRDDSATDFRQLSALHAPGLLVTATPTAGTVAARSSLLVRLTIKPLRVGIHGIFGLSLETVRVPGLFQAPLVFPNSLTVQVAPRTRSVGHSRLTRAGLWSERLGRSRANVSGDFRELREHRPGDPYHRIAWKASARRGKLLVVDNEMRDQMTSWVLVDVSQDLLMGKLGEAPLDLALDRVAEFLVELSAQGQRVGLIAFGRRVLFRIGAARGRAQVRRMIEGLCLQCHSLDADRSGWSLAEVQARVLEHTRFIARTADDRRYLDPVLFLELVDELRARAPFDAPLPFARSREEASLRRYLWAYGITAAPALESERPLSDQTLIRLLSELAASRLRPHHLHIFAPTPSAEAPLGYFEEFRRVRALGVRIHFHALSQVDGPEVDGPALDSPQSNLARLSVQVGSAVTERVALLQFKKAGVGVVEAQSGGLGHLGQEASGFQRAARE